MGVWRCFFVFKEICKFSLMLLFILLLVSTTILVARADEVGVRHQIVDLTTIEPDNVSLQYRFDSSFDWNNATFVSGYPQFQILSSSTFGYNYFPADNQGNRYAMQSRFQYNNGSYKDFRYTVDYTLPRYDFPFNSGYTSIYLVLSFRLYRTRSAPVDNGSIFTLTVNDNNVVSGSGLGFIVDQQSTEIEQFVYDTRYLIRFDSTVSNLSSVDRHLSLTADLSFDFEPAVDGYDYSRIFILSNVLPFSVTSEYNVSDTFASATYDILSGGILPSVDNIESLTESLLAEQERLTAIASAQASAISTLPAQIGAEMSGALHDEAQSEYQFGLNQGATEVSRAAAALPVGGVAEAGTALSQITGSISGNHRTGVWRMPRVYLPKLDGLMDELELIPEQDIALTDFFDRLPPSIIMILRAVCSVSLGVYIIKELILFVRKLRGGVENG